MAMIFGADSVQPANSPLSNGYDLFSWVMRKRSFPSFWARRFTGEQAMTEEEIEFLRNKNCRIALVFDDLTEVGVSSVNGEDDALRAVSAAKALGVPADGTIALFAAIGSDWSVSHNWMLSYASMLQSQGYVPGFIGNTDSSKNCSFDRECGHFLQATGDVEHYGAVYWATAPELNGEPDEWKPFCPSDMTRDRIDLWQNSPIVCDSVKADTVYGRDESILRYMW